jgi:flavin reductase (DIM6/NTAB) family NADH-FMN oxidoreductase RutF
MKSFIPSDLSIPKVHDLLLSSIAPRPIAFVSTVSAKGEINLSPFSFFNVFGANPPICIFSPARSGRTGETKNTLDFVNETKECVINIVNEDMLHQMNLASGEYPKGVNEFEKAGFTMLPSAKVKPPRVAESFVQLECKVMQVIETGTKGGSGNLVISEVVMIHVSETVLDEKDNILPLKMKYIARLGKDCYCRVDSSNLFEVPKPKIASALGMGFDQLPDFIKNSTELTGNELAQLASFDTIPALDSFDLSIETKSAKECISQGDLLSAWKILLASHK